MASDPYLVLARKWRPQTFEDVIGQEHITKTIQNAIAANRIGHAFLFIGSRGIGKTTTARVLAKALNCEAVDAPTPAPCGECGNCASIAAGTNIDVIEIDGASNRGIDDAKQIRENIRLVPARSRFKIYIIDEVHQLSRDAFNALLKTLEEPPAHAVFVLATTEAQKVPATIISRCQRYDFRRISLERLCELLRRILDNEGVACSDEALLAIARAADGGIRDAESILEQLISYCDKEISFEDVFDILGLVDWQAMHDLCDAILGKEIAVQLRIVEEIVVSGKDLSQFVQDILQYFRNLLVCKTADPKGLLALPEGDIIALQERAGKFTLTELIRLVEQFAELSKDFDSQLAQRIALEALLIRISKVAVEVSVDTVLEKLVQLGAGGASGSAPERPPANPKPAARPPNPPKAEARREPPAQPQPAEPADAPLDLRHEPPVEPQEPVPEPQARDRIELTSQNLAEEWPYIAQSAAKHSLNLGVWLGHVEPSAIEGETLVLSLAPDQARARSLLQRPENVQLMEETLRAYSCNVKAIRCELEDEPGALQRRGAKAAHRDDDAEDEAFRAAREDPRIAQVVNVFRGRVVAVKKREASPSEETPAP
jgi:DNA polymerase-3 subunit gamma/tau